MFHFFSWEIKSLDHVQCISKRQVFVKFMLNSRCSRRKYEKTYYYTKHLRVTQYSARLGHTACVLPCVILEMSLFFLHGSCLILHCRVFIRVSFWSSF